MPGGSESQAFRGKRGQGKTPGQKNHRLPGEIQEGGGRPGGGNLPRKSRLSAFFRPWFAQRFPGDLRRPASGRPVGQEDFGHAPTLLAIWRSH